MNLKQSKVILEKINALHKSMSMDENNIAAIERDLMLSYIKQLYELFIYSEASKEAGIQASIATREEKPAVRRTYTPPRIIEIPDTKRSNKVASSPDPVPDPMPDEPDPEPKREPTACPAPGSTPPPACTPARSTAAASPAGSQSDGQTQ